MTRERKVSSQSSRAKLKGRVNAVDEKAGIRTREYRDQRLSTGEKERGSRKVAKYLTEKLIPEFEQARLGSLSC